jgi:methylglutaconyl-CoA hydratase
MYLHCQIVGDVGEIVIDRPERRNALDGEGWRAVASAVGGCEGAPEVRTILIRSTGDVFCGGADLGWLRWAPVDELASVAEALEQVRNAAKPVVCRVQGPTFGGGIGLAAVADVVIAAPAAAFTLSEVRLGIAPALISRFVIERVGLARFRTWALLGLTVDAAAARAAGLVDVVAPLDGLDRATTEIVDALRRAEPAAAAAIKRIPPNGLGADDAARGLATLRDRPAFAEGIAALRENRPARWSIRSGVGDQP